ncbi:MAG: HEAT repeat domain-containing protein [Thermoguttaceae bacterium]
MSAGLQATFQFLMRTENEASVDILLAALNCPSETSRDFALRTLLGRRSVRGHEEIFRRLPTLDERSRAIISERPDRLAGVVSNALTTKDEATFQRACEVSLAFKLYDVLPTLLGAVAREDQPGRALAADTALQLTDLFYQELSAPESKDKDLDTLRRRMTAALEEGLLHYSQHGFKQIVEAFLLVTKQQNPTLRRILQQPGESSRQALIEVLSTSQRGGVIRILLSFLEDPQMPQAAREVIANRCDVKFVENLFQQVEPWLSRTVAESLARFNDIAWATPKHPLWAQLDDAAQRPAVRVIMASAIKRDKRLKVLGYLLEQGKPEGQRAAAAALAEFKAPEATVLVVKNLNNEDPIVRANLLKQLRWRNVPGAMSLLIRMVDSPHEKVREALRETLPEFTIRQYLINFETMPEELRSTAGHIVRKIDPEAEEVLTGEMKSLSRVRRRWAVLATREMGLIHELEKSVIELLSDEDHMVRIAAADTLAECDTLPSWEALRDAMLDRSVAVQETAEKSLERICQSLTTKTRGDLEEVAS